MRAWITPALIRYHDYKKHAIEDVQAPDRPSERHEWIDGTGWTIPQDIEDREAGRILDRADIWDRLIFELFYDLENRMRVQEGAQPVGRLVYRNALINRLKALRA